MKPQHGSARRSPMLGLLTIALACVLLGAATAVALAAKSHSHAKHAEPGSYSGTTSKPGEVPVTFKVSANGKHILQFSTSLGYDGKCGQGGAPSYEVKVASMAISSKGTFAAVTKGTFPVKSVKPIKVKVSGRISGGTASGRVFKPGAHCSATNKANPFSETFTASHL